MLFGTEHPLNGPLHSLLFAFLLALAIVCSSPAAIAAASTEPYASDVVFVKSAVEACLGEEFATVPLEVGDTLLIRSAAEHDKNWLVEEALTRLALGQGVHVVRAIEGKEAAWRRPYALSFRLVELALDCFAEHRGLLRRATTRRQVTFDAFLSMTDERSNVIWTAWARAKRSEAIPSRYDARLENADFMKRNVTESESKLMELVVIGGVVSSMVYLLF